MRILTKTLVLLAACWPLLAGNSQAAFVWNGQNGAPQAGQFVQVKFQDYEVALTPYIPNNPNDPFPKYSPQDIQARAIPLGFINPAGTNPDGSSVIGDELYSIFSVTSINSAIGGMQFWVDAPNQHLDGVISGTTLSSIAGSGASAVYNFTGGTSTLYFSGSVSNPFSASTGPWTPGWNGVALSNGVGSAGQSLVLSSIGVGGISADPTTTLTATLSALNPATQHFTGVGNGFMTDTLDTIFGFAPDGVDGSTFSPPYPGNQSVSFQTNFNNQPAGYASPLSFQTSTGWSVNNQDPITGQIDAPEPCSALLLGCGGLMIAGIGLRRRSRSA